MANDQERFLVTTIEVDSPTSRSRPPRTKSACGLNKCEIGCAKIHARMKPLVLFGWCDPSRPEAAHFALKRAHSAHFRQDCVRLSEPAQDTKISNCAMSRARSPKQPTRAISKNILFKCGELLHLHTFSSLLPIREELRQIEGLLSIPGGDVDWKQPLRRRLQAFNASRDWVTENIPPHNCVECQHLRKEVRRLLAVVRQQ